MTNGMETWKGNGNTTTLLFYLEGLEILHEERRGDVNTLLMEHLNSILFHKSGPANKQHTYSYSIVLTRLRKLCFRPNVYYLSIYLKPELMIMGQ